MRTNHQMVWSKVMCLSLLLLGSGMGPQAAAMGTAFTYQGQLNATGGVPVTNTCDFEFALYDALSGGTQIGTTVSKTGVTVTHGLLTTTLDFGAGVFDGAARWLDISVKCGAESAVTTLSPRQALTPTPYALYGADADADATNELNTTFTLNGATLELTDAGGR